MSEFLLLRIRATKTHYSLCRGHEALAPRLVRVSTVHIQSSATTITFEQEQDIPISAHCRSEAERWHITPLFSSPSCDQRPAEYTCIWDNRWLIFGHNNSRRHELPNTWRCRHSVFVGHSTCVKMLFFSQKRVEQESRCAALLMAVILGLRGRKYGPIRPPILPRMNTAVYCDLVTSGALSFRRLKRCLRCAIIDAHSPLLVFS